MGDVDVWAHCWSTNAHGVLLTSIVWFFPDDVVEDDYLLCPNAEKPYQSEQQPKAWVVLYRSANHDAIPG
jgi:hypothetical protein